MPQLRMYSIHNLFVARVGGVMIVSAIAARKKHGGVMIVSGLGCCWWPVL